MRGFWRALSRNMRSDETWSESFARVGWRPFIAFGLIVVTVIFLAGRWAVAVIFVH